MKGKSKKEDTNTSKKVSMESLKDLEDLSMLTMILRTRRISATLAISKIQINATCTHRELTTKMGN